MGVFKLGELHNVTAMLTLAIKKLPAESRPATEIMSLFNQALGMTLQRYDNKTNAVNKLNEVLCENQIRHLFLKGAAIKQYFPVAEVRTSGDTDLVIDTDNQAITDELLIKNGFELSQKTDSQSVLFYNNEEFEIKNYIDAFNKKTELFFSNAFDSKKCEEIDEYIYHLTPTYHLIYVISHFIRHLTVGGVGIRQLTDIDVLIRSGRINFETFYKTVDELGFGKSARVLIALSKEYFGTPAEINYDIDNELKGMLEKVMFEGGVFGFAISDAGTIRLIKSVNNSKSGFFSSLKALLMLIFPKKQVLYNSYSYCNKHHFLLPIAFFNRIFDAVFKRRKQNINSVKTILSDKSTAILISDIIDELEIEKDF